MSDPMDTPERPKRQEFTESSTWSPPKPPSVWTAKSTDRWLAPEVISVPTSTESARDDAPSTWRPPVDRPVLEAPIVEPLPRTVEPRHLEVDRRPLEPDGPAPLIPHRRASREIRRDDRRISIPLARVLPPTDLPRPSPVPVNRYAPVVAGAIAFGYGMVQIILTGTLLSQLVLPFLFGGIALAAACAIALMIQLFRQGTRDDRYRIAVEHEFAAPFTRYRVQSRAERTEIVLQLIAYEPRHGAGSKPNYEQSVVTETRFDAHDEIGVYEGLAELREEAADREQTAAAGWDSVIHALELQERVLGQLPDTTPRLHG